MMSYDISYHTLSAWSVLILCFHLFLILLHFRRIQFLLDKIRLIYDFVCATLLLNCSRNNYILARHNILDFRQFFSTCEIASQFHPHQDHCQKKPLEQNWIPSPSQPFSSFGEVFCISFAGQSYQMSAGAPQPLRYFGVFWLKRFWRCPLCKNNNQTKIENKEPNLNTTHAYLLVKSSQVALPLV